MGHIPGSEMSSEMMDVSLSRTSRLLQSRGYLLPAPDKTLDVPEVHQSTSCVRFSTEVDLTLVSTSIYIPCMHHRVAVDDKIAIGVALHFDTICHIITKEHSRLTRTTNIPELLAIIFNTNLLDRSVQERISVFCSSLQQCSIFSIPGDIPRILQSKLGI